MLFDEQVLLKTHLLVPPDDVQKQTVFVEPDNIINQFCFNNRGRYQGVWEKHVGASTGTNDPRHRGCKQADGGSYRRKRFRRGPGVGSWLSLSNRTL